MAFGCYLPFGVRSIHRIGNLVGALTDCLEVVLFNNLEDLASIGTLQLGSVKGAVLDFAVLDFDGTQLSPMNRMIVHVDTGSKNKILLTDVLGTKIVFEFECAEKICLNASTAQTELNNNVVIVESFSAKR
jgi:hypothetical protein